MNKIEAVADILGLKIYEEFDVDKVPYGPEWNNSRVVNYGRFRFTYDGLEEYYSDNKKWLESETTMFNRLLKGGYSIKKHVLTLKEKSYLEHMISPYEKYVKTFEKKSYQSNDHDYEYICITSNDVYDETNNIWTSHLLPPGTMFKFMELNKVYEKYQLELEEWKD